MTRRLQSGRARSLPCDRAAALLLAVAATAGALLTCEVVFRRFLVRPAVPTTEDGFRSQIASSWLNPIPIERREGRLRIVGLADSFGRAGELRNYHYLLEEKLRARGVPAEVVNVSAAAFEPVDELPALTRFGLRYRPDIVLHGFFVGNDFSTPRGTLVEFRGILMRELPGMASWLPHRLLLVKWVHHYAFAVLDALRRRLETAQLGGLAFAAQAGGADTGTFSETEFLRIERERLEICRRRTATVWMAEPALAILDDIRRATEQAGARYVLVIHPDQLQVEEPLRRRIAATFDVDVARDYDLTAPQNALLAYCASRQIPCLDLLPTFQATGADGGLYRLRDTHYSDAGNERAAEAIHGFLREQRLTP